MKHNKDKISFAKKIRKNASTAEVKFWYAINNNQLGVKFRRQQIIGKYIVDFICHERKIIIELDGDQHAKAVEYDNTRTKFLESFGYNVIRIPNQFVYSELDAIVHSLKLVLNGVCNIEVFFQSRYKGIPPPKIL